MLRSASDGEPGGVRTTPTAPLAAALALFLTTMVLIVATLNRGLDWSDESFVLTLIASNRISTGEAWGFQHLLHPLAIAFGDSVLALRVMRLLGYLLLSLLLTWTAVTILARFRIRLSRREQLFILVLGQAGTLAAWSYSYRTLGYNDLSGWLAQAIAAMLLLGISVRAWERARLSLALPWFVAGLLVPVLVVAKFTGGVAALAVVTLAVALPSHTPRLLIRVLAVVTGGLVGTALLLAVGVPLGAVVANSLTLIFDTEAAAQFDHSIPEILRAYRSSAFITGASALPALIVLLVLALTATWAARSRVPAVMRTASGAAPLLLGIMLLLPFSFLVSWNALGTLVAFCGFGTLVVLLSRWRVWASWSRRDRWLMGGGIIVLLVMPLVSAVGTNNFIFGQLTFAATLWAVSLASAIVYLARLSPGGMRGRVLAAGVAPLLVFGVAVAMDIFTHPYRTTPYFSQTTSTAAPALRGVQLTAPEARVADWLTTAAEENEAHGVPAVSIGSPGHLLLFNHSGWATPWIGATWAMSIEAACEQGGAPRDLFVIDAGQPAEGPYDGNDEARLVESLTSCSIAFPGDFRTVGEGPDGTVLWRLRYGAVPG